MLATEVTSRVVRASNPSPQRLCYESADGESPGPEPGVDRRYFLVSGFIRTFDSAFGITLGTYGGFCAS
jgi:hypothetical protein